MKKLTAYKKNKYVDSISSNNEEDIKNFYEDFKDCNIRGGLKNWERKKFLKPQKREE